MTKTPHHNDLRGAPIAARLIAEVKEATSELKMAGWNAKLMSITIGDVTAVDLYVRNQRRRAAEAGIEFQEQHYPETITQIEIESALRALNAKLAALAHTYDARSAAAAASAAPLA